VASFISVGEWALWLPVLLLALLFNNIEQWIEIHIILKIPLMTNLSTQLLLYLTEYTPSGLVNQVVLDMI
jgi:hypothetical protein